MRLKSLHPQPLLAGDDDELVDFILPTGCQPWATVRARTAEVRLLAWLPKFRGRIEALFETFGAVLFRGFSTVENSEFRDLVRKLDGDPMEYRERSTPRTDLGGGLYTSTEYPAAEEIALHSEFSYANRWPGRIWFHCVLPASSGGETLLASTRQIYESLAGPVRDLLEKHGIRYVRHYGLGIDLPWQEVFQTSDRTAVEAYCAAEQLGFAWLPSGRLQTWQDRPAMLRHPRHGWSVWFNQAHLFHPSGLNASVRQGLEVGSAGKQLPRMAELGGGGELADETLAEVRRAIAGCTVPVPWCSGDTLLVDNMSMAHGRAPYIGARSVLVMLTSVVQR